MSLTEKKVEPPEGERQVTSEHLHKGPFLRFISATQTLMCSNYNAYNSWQFFSFPVIYLESFQIHRKVEKNGKINIT